MYIAKKINPTTSITIPVSKISVKTGLSIQILMIKSTAINPVATINKMNAVRPAILGRSIFVINSNLCS